MSGFKWQSVTNLSKVFNSKKIFNFWKPKLNIFSSPEKKTRMSVDLVVEKCKQPQKNILLKFEDEGVSNHSSLGYVNEQVM